MNKELIIVLIVLCGLLTGCGHGSQWAVEALPFRQSDGQWGLLSLKSEADNTLDTFGSYPTSIVNGCWQDVGLDSCLYLHIIAPSSRVINFGKYYQLGYFFEPIALAQKTPDSPFVLVDKEGKEKCVLDSNIYLAHNFHEELALVYTNKGKYGYINTQGEYAIPAVYDYATDFSEGRALVGQLSETGNIEYTFINKKGEFSLSGHIGNLILGSHYSDGLLNCIDLVTRQCVCINKAGNIVFSFPKYVKSVSSYQFGLAVVQTLQGRGLADKDGEICIRPIYDDVRIISANRVALRRNGKWTLTDKLGNILLAETFDDIVPVYVEGKSVVCKGAMWALMDSEGEISNKGWLDKIVVDSCALGIKPQVFIRLLGSSVAANNPISDNNLLDTLSSEKQASVPERVKHMIKTDWMNVGKENPFYEEAMKVVSGKLEEEDAANRRVILNYVEHLRMAYITKDIDFLEQLFSERALIVVGTVIKTLSKEENAYLSPQQVVYNVKSKREYIDRLKVIFQMNKRIDLKFSDFKIMRHPTVDGIYGVNLRQIYDSDIYSDDGYLFLLWDFRDPSMPQIHVRTWQPAFLEDHTPLPEDEVFHIRNFNLQ